jgi:hypothetical protein
VVNLIVHVDGEEMTQIAPPLVKSLFENDRKSQFSTVTQPESKLSRSPGVGVVQSSARKV